MTKKLDFTRYGAKDLYNLVKNIDWFQSKMMRANNAQDVLDSVLNKVIATEEQQKYLLFKINSKFN